MVRSRKMKAQKCKKNVPAAAPTKHFSMQQEARNTEARNRWRLGAQLRHQAVQFISAGNLEREKEVDLRTDDEEIQSISEQHPTNSGPKIHSIIGREILSQPIDAAGEATTDMGHVDSTSIRHTPTSPYLSSEDEIVFNGRRSRTEPECHLQRQSPYDISSDLQWEENADGESSGHPLDQDLDRLWSPIDSTLANDPETIDYFPVHANGESSKTRRSKQSDEDDLLADYIANMDQDYEYLNKLRSPDHQQTINRTISCDTPGEELTKPLVFQNDSSDASEDSDLEGLENTDSGSDDDPLLEDGAGFQSINSQHQRGSIKNIFAPPTAFADSLESNPFYGFDTLDFDCPSLRKHKKGKHQYLNLELSDAELQSKIENAWSNDRIKKKIKKQERQELRSQGLLGRRKDDPDLKVKYAHGMGVEDLKSEIRLFLLSTKNSLPLPPMPKQRRMLVHQYANALSLNSQSRGKGSSRFPILSKTSHTPKHTPRTVSQIENLFSLERYPHRASRPWDKKPGKSGKSNRGHGSVSYMDGDVVGASAPEIGVENRGRAMLEKMGWSTGTALGATHNKGILLPVAHVVKNSKAGLG